MNSRYCRTLFFCLVIFVVSHGLACFGEPELPEPEPPEQTVAMELVSVEPQTTEKGVKLAVVRKPTLAYLEVIERSPNASSVTRVTHNEDTSVQIGGPVLSPIDDIVLFRILVEEENDSWYSNIQKVVIGSFGTTRLTFGKWRDLFPAFTPDGQNVVFSSTRTSANATLWRVKLEGASGLTKITSTQAEDFAPSVFPDGTAVAYASNPTAADESQIWTIPMMGRLATQLREGESPQVSPDASHILFVRKNNLTNNRQIWVMTADGSEETQLTQNADFDAIDARWSPDGKWIVFACNEGLDSHQLRNFDIWAMAADGSRRTQLTTNGSRDDSPCWDRKGEYVYFRSNRGGAWNIWRFRPLLGKE